MEEDEQVDENGRRLGKGREAKNGANGCGNVRYQRLIFRTYFRHLTNYKHLLKTKEEANLLVSKD